MRGDFQSLYQLVFFSAAIVLALLERVPVFQRGPSLTAKRWTSNIGLFFIGALVSGLVLPIGIYGLAEQQPLGLMSRLRVPFVAQLVATFLLLDFWKYWEHRIFHRVPLLWRMHLVHHSDTHVDVTTSERHHPFELLLSVGVLAFVVLGLGLPATALALYLLTATVIALWSHANVRLPSRLERQLERFIVTPRMHTLHHSELETQTNSNYGAVLSVWDRLFGTYVDPDRATIPHYGLRYFHHPRDTTLTRVLLQPLLFRRDLDYPERVPAPPASIAASHGLRVSGRHKRILAAGALGCVLMMVAMWPSMLQLTHLWRNSEAYQFAWLVIPMFVYAFRWRVLTSRGRFDPEPDFSGMPVVVVAAVLYATAALMNIDIGQQFALVLAVQGVAMSTLGWRCYRWFFPVLALLFFMIPLNDLLIPVLRPLTLESIRLLAVIAGLPHSVDGFVIHVGTHRYIVIDECAGLTYVTLASFLGYCFGLLLYRSLRKIAAVCLLGAFLGFVSNMARVNSIVLIDWVRDSQMDLAAHGYMQWIALFAVLGLLFLILSRLPTESAPPTVAASSRTRKGPGLLAPVAAGLSALIIAGGAAGLQNDQRRLPHGEDIRMFPHRIVDWYLVDQPRAWSVDQTGASESIDLTYRGEQRDVRIFVVDGLSSAAKLQQAALVPHGGGTWREKHVVREVGCRNAECVSMVHATWQRERSEDVRHVYFAYGIGDFTTDSKLAIRAAHGWHKLMGTRNRPRLIAFIADEAPLEVNELAAAFKIVLQATRESSPGSGKD